MRRIRAVAINTIRQAIRMKIVLAFMLILIVLIPVMALGLTGDGTIKGRLQSFVTYSLSLTSLILSLMTIILTTYSLTEDIYKKYAYMVLTKPIRRFELLLGKLAGVIFLDVVVLFFCAGLIYAATLYIPHHYGASEEQLSILNNGFFTARSSLRPPVPDVRAEVVEEYKKLQAGHQLPEGMSTQSIMRELTNRKLYEKRAVEPGRDIVWEFSNVRIPDPNENIFIRFKYDVAVNPPDNVIYSVWDIGDLRQIDFVSGSSTPLYRTQRQDIIRTFREFSIKADAVADDGYLGVAFLNVPFNPTVVIFPPEDGLEVLYKSSTYTANFVRGILLILFRLIFLACLGILASSFLSFPVAILLCVTIFCLAVSRGFIMESFNYLSQEVHLIYGLTIRLLIQFIPQFDQLNAANYLVSAQLISWSAIAQIAALVVALKAGILLVLALVIFSFREIARVTV